MRIAIATLGCKVNQYDSAVIQSRLEGRHEFVPFEEKADFYIINACTVTDRADWEARQLVRRAKRLNPHGRILVTGCYAQVSPEEVARLPEVNFVVGLNRLGDLIRTVEGSAPGSLAVSAEQLSTRRRGAGWVEGAGSGGARVSVGDIGSEAGVPVLEARAFPDHTRAFLKIQEGCDYSCTYCVIPIARGRSRSVPPETVLDQVRSLAGRGYLEIVLTGIHLGGYGRDLRPKADLASLVERILASRLVPRLRLSSLDPREVPDRLLRLMAECDALCPHLHICAQAGSDGILRRMRRNYDTAYYRDLILKAREALPDASLGTDIIVGFPGESDVDFHRSLEFFDSLPLTYFHVFPYSPRRGTVAAELPDRVPPAVKRKRAREMRELGERKKRQFYRTFLGRRVRVLLERPVDGEAGSYRGRSRNYLPVSVHAPGAGNNREVDVLIERLENGWLRGRLGG